MNHVSSIPGTPLIVAFLAGCAAVTTDAPAASPDLRDARPSVPRATVQAP